MKALGNKLTAVRVVSQNRVDRPILQHLDSKTNLVALALVGQGSLDGLSRPRSLTKHKPLRKGTPRPRGLRNWQKGPGGTDFKCPVSQGQGVKALSFTLEAMKLNAVILEAPD